MLLFLCGYIWSIAVIRCLADCISGRRSRYRRYAAKTIQNKVRSMQAKRRFHLQRQAAIKIQKHIRGFLVRQDALSLKYDECPISFQLLLPPVSMETICGHRFRIVALNQWLNKDDSCPLCRRSQPKQLLKSLSI